VIQYGGNCMSFINVYEWVDRFKGRQPSVEDACSTVNICHDH